MPPSNYASLIWNLSSLVSPELISSVSSSVSPALIVSVTSLTILYFYDKNYLMFLTFLSTCFSFYVFFFLRVFLSTCFSFYVFFFLRVFLLRFFFFIRVFLLRFFFFLRVFCFLRDLPLNKPPPLKKLYP